jgi:hypothetical protein
LKDFKKTDSGFRVELQLNSNKGRKSRMVIKSAPDAVVFMEIPADSSKLPSAGWLLAAIENDPLAGGKRTILWNGNSKVIRERSGISIYPISTSWINVDNWIGFVTVPEGTLTYQTAKKYNRNGAAEDRIYYQSKVQNAPRAVIVLPGKDTMVTAKVQQSLTWSVTRTECLLTFTRPAGEKMEVKMIRNK